MIVAKELIARVRRLVDDSGDNYSKRVSALLQTLEAGEVRPANQMIFSVGTNNDGKRIDVSGPGIWFEIDTDDVDHCEVYESLAKMLSILEEHWGTR